MTFDTDAYIRDLAAIHGLAPKPGDTDGSELTGRAARAELADIQARTQALHDWSAAVITDRHRRTAEPGAYGPEPRAARRPANRRSRSRRANPRHTPQHG